MFNVKSLNMRIYFAAMALAVVFSVSGQSIDRGLIAQKAMVVSARAEASQIGVDILKKGGNAFDAMIATDLTLAVSFPFAGNIGGGGFMVYRLKDGSYGSLDYREKAPAAAHRDMYLDQNGEVIPQKSTLGATAVGVPGTVAGLYAVHQKFGTLPWKDLVQPAIDLARKGIVVTQRQAQSLAGARDLITRINHPGSLYAQPYEAGDTLKNPALARTLSVIAQKGKDGFYRGEVAEKMTQLIQDKGGYITLEDLQNYSAVWRNPIVFPYKDLNIISMSPPSSGGITLAQMFGMLRQQSFDSLSGWDSNSIHASVEVARRAYADRNYYLGDPDFVDIDTAALTNPDYLASRMSTFEVDRATPSAVVGHGQPQTLESDQTTHYSIVDAQGNAVAVTTTLNGAYGSKLFSDELGMFFNNEMDDFSAKAGVPNMFGLIGAAANEIAPGKRMLSSMTPTIVERDGKLWAVVGTPGGSTIISAVFQTILSLRDFGMGMQEAVNAPRFHHQWLPDVLIMEPDRFSPAMIESLQNMGHQVNQQQSRIIGKVDAILVLKDGSLEAGADPRGDDAASGF
jgi:gamma-glutamyltranspeptidase/glutathione hydrolase